MFKRFLFLIVFVVFILLCVECYVILSFEKKDFQTTSLLILYFYPPFSILILYIYPFYLNIKNCKKFLYKNFDSYNVFIISSLIIIYCYYLNFLEFKNIGYLTITAFFLILISLLIIFTNINLIEKENCFIVLTSTLNIITFGTIFTFGFIYSSENIKKESVLYILSSLYFTFIDLCFLYVFIKIE